MDRISVCCLKYAESLLPERMVFHDGDKDKMVPISFAIYLIRIADRNILVDAGCDTLPGFDIKEFCSPAVAIKSVGLSVEDVTDVIITHAHHDHIEAVNHFKNAVIHIAESEYEKGKKYIPAYMKVNKFEKELAISSQIKVVEWGGHSRGSSIIEIKTDTLTHILAGDECYTKENLNMQRCTGAFFNKERAAEFVRKYSGEQYRVHTCHDITLVTERII